MTTQDIKVEGYAIPTPLSKPLNLFYTYDDAAKALVRVAELYYELEGTHPSALNWQLLRNQSGDSMGTLIAILERRLEKKAAA